MGANSIKRKYIDTFFWKLTKKEKDEIYFDNYMWHAFSYKKVNAKEGISAIDEFKKNYKNSVYIVFQNKDTLLERDNLTYEELIYDVIREVNTADCYVIDKNFKWTFVITHETYEDIFESDSNEELFIGPFFAVNKT